MTPRCKATLLASLLSLLVAGCAAHLHETDQEAVLPEIDVERVNKNTEESLKLSMEVKLDLEALTVKTADLDNKIQSLSEDVSNVSSAKIEELETRLALITEAFKGQQEELQRLEVLTRAGAAPATATAGNKTVEGKTNVPMKDAPVTVKTNTVPTFSPSSAASLLLSPEYEAYQTGLRLFGSRKYQLAIKAFGDMLDQFPGGKYTDGADYWIGESYFALEEYPAAIGFFEKTLTFKGSAKNDDASFKLGLSYLRIGQQAKAKDIFRILLEQSPGSEYSSRTQRYLKQLK
jgi:TolA-binding protein